MPRRSHLPGLAKGRPAALQRRFGMLAALLAAGAVAAAPAAASDDAQPAAEASAVLIRLPDGSQATTEHAVSAAEAAHVAGGAWQYPKDDGLVTIAGSRSDALPDPSATAEVSGLELFGGEVTATSLSVSAGATPDALTSAVDGLVVDGAPVAADAGTVPLGDWGTATFAAGGAGAAGAPSPLASGIAALEVDLSADHEGLPAGTHIFVALAGAVPSAPVAEDPAPVSSGSQDDGSDAGSTPAATKAPAAPRHVRRHPRPHRRPGERRTVARTAPPAAASTSAIASLPGLSAVAPRGLGRDVRSAVVRAAAAQIGWPYVWGGESRSEGGFDCSGLVDYAFTAAGHPLPGRPTAAVLWHMAAPVDRSQLQPGDLAFLGTANGEPYHVALYVGDGSVVVASHRGEPIGYQPLDAVGWDGFGRLWSPAAHGFVARVSHVTPAPLAPAALRHERTADRVAATRARGRSPLGAKLGAHAGLAAFHPSAADDAAPARVGPPIATRSAAFGQADGAMAGVLALVALLGLGVQEGRRRLRSR